VEIPVIFTEITAANFDFDFAIPKEVLKKNEDAGIWVSYSCKKARVNWYPGFDFSSGTVKVIPEIVSIEGIIEKRIDYDAEIDDEIVNIDISAQVIPEIVWEDDNSDRCGEYSPHSIRFVIVENDKIISAIVYYS